jgi:zinc transport system ATP-binding protein
MPRNIDSESLHNNKAVSCGACCTRIEDLSVSFGNTEILKNINLHLHCGQLAVIIGPNGAGKSTLFRALTGEIPYTGKIKSCLSSSKAQHDMITGYVPQKLDFDNTSPVNVLDLFSVSLSKRPVWLGRSKQVVKQALHSLEQVNAANLVTSRIGTLSGGQIQRVLLALALTPIPDLLLLDEPASGIDPSGTELFYSMVSDLRIKHHLAILIASHDCEAAAKYADRMLFLNHTIQCDGDPADVLSNEIVVRAFGRIGLPKSYKTKREPRTCLVTGKEI